MPIQDEQKESLGKEVKFIKKENTENKQYYTLGIVYEPHTDEEILNNPELADTQKDYANADEIEKSCWNFTKELQKGRALNNHLIDVLSGIKQALTEGQSQIDITELLDEMNKSESPLGVSHIIWSDNFGTVVENYIAPVDFLIGEEKVRKGTWLIGIQWHPTIYEEIEKGEFQGLSLGGTAKRISIEP